MSASVSVCVCLCLSVSVCVCVCVCVCVRCRSDLPHKLVAWTVFSLYTSRRATTLNMTTTKFRKHAFSCNPGTSRQITVFDVSMCQEFVMRRRRARTRFQRQDYLLRLVNRSPVKDANMVPRKENSKNISGGTQVREQLPAPAAEVMRLFPKWKHTGLDVDERSPCSSLTGMCDFTR